MSRASCLFGRRLHDVGPVNGMLGFPFGSPIAQPSATDLVLRLWELAFVEFPFFKLQVSTIVPPRCVGMRSVSEIDRQFELL